MKEYVTVWEGHEPLVVGERIVRCRDCKRIDYCQFFKKDKNKPNGFCAWGVRKEVNNDN